MKSQTRDKLLKVLRMTTSTHDGEVVNAARAANRILSADGYTWDHVVGLIAPYDPPPPPRPPPPNAASVDADVLADIFNFLLGKLIIPDATKDWVRSVKRQWMMKKHITEGQRETLITYYVKYGGGL